MIYKNLGHSPLKVSRICLGTMMFADQTNMAEARSIVDHAKENGCNFIDTADVYTFGKSEHSSRSKGSISASNCPAFTY